MNHKWSLLVIIISASNVVSQQVLNFDTLVDANIALKKITNKEVPCVRSLTVIPLY